MVEQQFAGGIRRSVVAAASAALIDAFEANFDLWVLESSQWSLVSWDDEAPRLAPESGLPVEEVRGYLHESAVDHRQPRLVPLQGQVYLLIVPLPHDGSVPAIATTCVETSEPRALLRLARMFSKEFERSDEFARLRDENTAYAQQVTEDFEELVFLRQMAEHLEVSEVSKDLVEMAETILPLLIQSIKSEALAIIAADPENAECPVGQPVLWAGPRVIDDRAAQRLVQRYHQDASVQAVVRNTFHRTEEGEGFPGVRGFVLVSMSKGNGTSGWLLALNRVKGHDYSNSRDDLWQLSDLEFGTGEASLLCSAATMLATHARNVELFREKEKLLIEIVRALVSTVEAKDEYTCGHSERVALFGRRLGEELGLPEEQCEQLYLTGVLHDVGKIAIRDATLTKPDRLTDEEFEEIKQHPEAGWMILRDLEQLKYVLPGVLYHHERYDGKGYPDGLVGEDIPLDGRILAVADAYDAMTSDRPYRKGMPQEKAEAILLGGAGTQWDARLIDAFFRIMPEIIQIRESYERRESPTRDRNDDPSDGQVR